MDFTWSLRGSDEHAAGAAMRRRQRRLRSWLRHERMTVAMALADSTHHSSRRQTNARAGARVEQHGNDPGPPTHQLELFKLSFRRRVRRDAAGPAVCCVPGRRSESRGVSWNRLMTLHQSSRLSTILIRRWWTQRWKSFSSSSSVGRLLPRTENCETSGYRCAQDLT